MGGDQTTARIRCNRDALCSPTSWELHFTNQLRQASRYVTFSKSGAVAGGVLMKDGKPARRTKRLAAYTCDWSLFDAVQRLAGGKVTAALDFDLVEYLDVVRENQVLKYRGKTQIRCTGQNAGKPKSTCNTATASCPRSTLSTATASCHGAGQPAIVCAGRGKGLEAFSKPTTLTPGAPLPEKRGEL